MSRLQNVVTLSTVEVDYVAVIEACKELILLNYFMKELGKKQ